MELLTQGIMDVRGILTPEQTLAAKPPTDKILFVQWMITRTYTLKGVRAIAFQVVESAPEPLKSIPTLEAALLLICKTLHIDCPIPQAQEIIKNLMQPAMKANETEKADYRHSRNSLERAKQIAAQRANKIKKLVRISYLLRGKKAVTGIHPARVAAFLLSNPNAIVLTPQPLKNLVKFRLACNLVVCLLPERLEGFLEQHEGAKVLTPKRFELWKKANAA